MAEVRDFKDISERLADLYEDQERVDEGNKIRQHTDMDSAAIRHTLEVGLREKVLRQKTTFTFGDEGLPLSELAALENLARAPSSKVTGTNRKVGRNECAFAEAGRSSRSAAQVINQQSDSYGNLSLDVYGKTAIITVCRALGPNA